MSFDDQFSKSSDEVEYLNPHNMVLLKNISRNKYYMFSDNLEKKPMWRSRKVEQSSHLSKFEAYVSPHKMANLNEMSGSMRSPDKNKSQKSTSNVRKLIQNMKNKKNNTPSHRTSMSKEGKKLTRPSQIDTY